MRQLVVLMAMAGVASACAIGTSDDGVGGDDGAGPGSSSGTGGSTNTTSTDDDLTGSSSSSSTSSTSSSSTSSTSGTTSSGGDDLCEPDPNDDPCLACAKTQCCSVIDSCMQDPDCQCWIDCVPEQSVQVCYGQCGLPVGIAELLLDCVLQSCAGDCGF